MNVEIKKLTPEMIDPVLHFPLEMYLEQGFEIVQELEHQFLVHKVIK